MYRNKNIKTKSRTQRPAVTTHGKRGSGESQEGLCQSGQCRVHNETALTQPPSNPGKDRATQLMALLLTEG